MENENGDTLIAISCEKRNLNIIKYLIKKGAKTDINNSTGNSLLNIVCKTESKESLEILNYFIKELKIDINSKDKNGNTPLLIACYFGNIEIISKLLESGANINIQNNYGDSPLMISCFFKNKKIIQKLKKNGADENILNNYGYSVLKIKGINNNNKNDVNNIFIKSLLNNYNENYGK